MFLPTPSYGICLQFWYHMYGKGMGSLNLYVNVSNTTSLLWTQNGNKGNQWNNGQVAIKSGKSFRLMIEAIRGTDFTSDVAIDDIDFIEKSCENFPSDSNPINLITIPVITTTKSLRPVSYLDCNFENDYCKWNPSIGNNFNWTRAQGKQGTQTAGPLDFDHSLGIPEGWYLTTNIANRLASDVAKIESTLITSPRCMEFHYLFFTNSKFTFNVYVKVNDQLGLPIWSRSNSQGDFWRLGRVTVTSGSSYKIVFELKSVLNGVITDKIAIDDIFFTSGACQDSSDVNKVCTFSNGNLCDYKINTSNNFQWKLFDPQALARASVEEKIDEKLTRVGPVQINDHTTGGLGSGYVYVESTNFKLNDTALMTSKIYAPFDSSSQTLTSRCLEFYFYLRGTNSIKINVKALIPPSSVPYPLWTRSYDHNNLWWKGETNINFISNHSLIFEAIVGSNPSGGIAALDDIVLRNGACSSLVGTCDFDKKDFCNWANTNESDFNWLLYSGPTPTLLTGPTNDHTSGNKQGYYIYIETSIPTVKDWNAQLISEPLNEKNLGCINFWFHMYGADIGALNVYLLSDDKKNKDLLWTVNGATGNTWMQGQAPFQTNISHQIMFEGVAGKGIYGDIALDDLAIKREPCQIQPAEAMPQLQASQLVDCDFENGYCSWTNGTANFNWTFNNGETPSFDTGPSSGADSSKGYLYIETSNTKEGDKARLLSKSIPRPSDDNYCLSFYYHMWGADIGGLIVLTSISGKESTIFTKNGSNVANENKWKSAFIKLTSKDITSDFKIAFDGIAGNGFQGDIAIDETKLRIGECPPSLICDFETDYCNWINDTTSNFYWTRSKNATSSIGTGPSIDHTTLSQNGYYIFIETSFPQKLGDKARLISPTYSATVGSGNCFKFWYHLYGADIGSLNVWIRQNNQLFKNIWSRSGNLGNTWRYGHVSVKSIYDYQMVLEGVVGSSHLGDAAVDDIEITNGECYSEGSCDFEDEYCGYYNTKDGDDFDWEKGKGPLYSSTGPTVDHTTNTQDGSYVFINPSYTHNKGDKAWLISEVLSLTEAACLNWYMHLYGNGIGNLSIYQRIYNKNLTILWKTSGNKGDKWILGQITIQPQSNYFDLIFEATVGNSVFGNIALDDINLVKGGSCEFFNSTTTKQTTSNAPPFGLSCDFEDKKFCDWYPDPLSDKQWSIQSGNSAVYGSAPLNDVTTSSSQGYYVYVSTNLNIQYGTAILRSPSLISNQESCLEFWYQLNGPSASGLTITLKSKSNKTELWKRKGNLADTWSHAYVRAQIIGDQWLEFEG